MYKNCRGYEGRMKFGCIVGVDSFNSHRSMLNFADCKCTQPFDHGPTQVGLFGHFFSRLSLLFSFSLSLGDGPI